MVTLAKWRHIKYLLVGENIILSILDNEIGKFCCLKKIGKVLHDTWQIFANWFYGTSIVPLINRRILFFFIILQLAVEVPSMVGVQVCGWGNHRPGWRVPGQSLRPGWRTVSKQQWLSCALTILHQNSKPGNDLITVRHCLNTLAA